MISLLSFLHFFTLVIIIVFVALPSSDGADNWFKACSTLLFSCGDIKDVGYPFWGDGRPRHCGDPAMQLQCISSLNGSDSFLKVDSKDLSLYKVLNLTISDRTIALRLHGAPKTDCAYYGKDVGEILQFDKSVEMVNVLYSCGNAIEQSQSDGNVTCYQNQTATRLYYRHNASALGEYASCNSSEVPVSREELARYTIDELSFNDVLKRGFEVNYEYSLSCIKCRNSGCLCGSSVSSDFLCLCTPALSKSQRLIIIGSVVSAIGIILLIVIIWRLRKRPPMKFAAFWKSEALTCPNVDAFLQIYGSFALTRHTYVNLKKMTNGFRDKLGEGGFATVYKGMLTNGRLVAVKLLKQSKGNGEDFLNEVASLSRTNHVNIMSLLGFCFEGNIRALIYEFMPNGSLEKFTWHGATSSSLPWETLFSIAIGIAKGLDYLHRGCNARILHFDIKPHNILLDEEFIPKISDFGLARLCPLQESIVSMLEARGTIGYIAPEVFCRNFGGVSHKSDVYSFGMMVLDVVCGRKNLSAEQQKSSDLFPKWIYDQLELQDEAAFHGTTNDEEKALQRKMILVSLWCIQTYPSNRPSMSTVVEMLQGRLESIQMPPKADLSSPPRLTFDTSGTLALTASD